VEVQAGPRLRTELASKFFALLLAELGVSAEIQRCVVLAEALAPSAVGELLVLLELRSQRQVAPSLAASSSASWRLA
jgi:hypothetical protein